MPPKGIFGDYLDEKPSVNLVTVPSCDECNLRATQDDVYFRDSMFLFAQRFGKAPHTAKIHSAMVRSARHAGVEFRAPIETLIKSGRPVLANLEPGELVIEGTVFEADWMRIKRVVERSARGLYWKHRKQRVPDDYVVSVLGAKEVELLMTPEQVEVWTASSIEAIHAFKRHVHSFVFSYAIKFLPENERAAILSFTFYRGIFFVIEIVPKEDLRIVLSAPATSASH